MVQCAVCRVAAICSGGAAEPRGAWCYEKLTNTLWMERSCMPFRQVGHFFCARTASTRQS